jgi:hypothetical protein
MSVALVDSPLSDILKLSFTVSAKNSRWAPLSYRIVAALEVPGLSPKFSDTY